MSDSIFQWSYFGEASEVDSQSIDGASGNEDG